MMQPNAHPEYESRLRKILADGDWAALREFARSENQIPDDIYDRDEHFWMVLLHKLICNRIDQLHLHAASRAWLDRNGYSTDLGGF